MENRKTAKKLTPKANRSGGERYVRKSIARSFD